MSNPDGQGEPSMEEILASIRRIISEDDKEQNEGTGQAAGESAEADPDALAATDNAGDDILDLTEKAEDPGSQGEDAPYSEAMEFPATSDLDASPGEPLGPDSGATAPDPFAALEEAGFGDELTNAQQDGQDDVADGLDEMAPMPESDPEGANQSESVIAGGIGDNAVQDEPEEPMSRDNSQEGLVSSATAAATVAALSEASRDIRSQARAAEDLPIQNDKTLEGLVREAVKPLLKEWLDQNLAPLVERVVREEVRRLVRRAEDD